MNNRDLIHSTIKKLQETIKNAGYKKPVIMYTYVEEVGGEETILSGYESDGALDVLGSCELIRHKTLLDMKEED